VASFVGVDGCRGGWFAVWLEQEQLQGAIFPDIASLHMAHSDARKVLIDIPIGLLGTAQRLLEQAVRQRLGPRRSSVFPVPCFAAAYAPDYPTANQTNRDKLGKGLSKQAWYLCPKIREVNDFLLANPQWQDVLGESHPELAFAVLNGAPMAETKKSVAGSGARIEVLNASLPDVTGFLGQQLNLHPRNQLLPDDCVDALVLLVAAQQTQPLLMPHPQVGEGGIPIQMWVPA
jgi:predicted RNase H-like nuclease